MLTIQNYPVSNFQLPPILRSPAVRFTGQIPDRFEKTPTAFEQALRKQYGGSIHKLIEDAVKEQHFIGRGAGASVYRIPKMPELVIRVDNKINISQLPSELKPKFWKLLPVSVGQPLVSFMDDEIQVQAYQAGITTKVSLGSLIQKYGLIRLFDEQEQQPLPDVELAGKRAFYIEHLEYIDAMPQEAYDDLAQTLKVLNNYPDLYFDPNIRNILADRENKVFNLVDLTGRRGLGPYKSAAGMAMALIDSVFIHLEETCVDQNGKKLFDNVAQDTHALALRHSILTKTFLAAYRTGLSFPEEDWSYIPSPDNGTRRRYMDMNYVCRVSSFDWQKVKALLRLREMTEMEFLNRLKTCQ